MGISTFFLLNTTLPQLLPPPPTLPQVSAGLLVAQPHLHLGGMTDHRAKLLQMVSELQQNVQMLNPTAKDKKHVPHRSLLLTRWEKVTTTGCPGLDQDGSLC